MGIQKKLSTLVKEFIDEQEGESVHNFRRYLGFATRALRFLHLDVSGAPKHDMLTVDENSHTVELPNDCIKVLAIGEVTANNYLKPLILKNNMLLNTDASQGFKSYMYGDCGSVSTLYGQNSVTGKAYRQDHLNNTIKVSSGTTGCLYIEYLPDIEKMDGNYLVHPYYFEAVISYIRWANVRSNPNMARNLVREFKNEWIQEKRMAQNRQSSMTIDQIIKESRKTLTASIRA